MGDFIGNQKYENSDVSKILKISIKRKKDKKLEVQLSYDKTIVALSNAAGTKYKLVDLDAEIDKYDNDDKDKISKVEYDYLLEVKYDLDK